MLALASPLCCLAAYIVILLRLARSDTLAASESERAYLSGIMMGRHGWENDQPGAGWLSQRG